jgi:hypothetical protein
MSEPNSMSIRYGAIRSRRLLIDAIKALSPFREALVVIGAHAIHVWAQQAWGPIEMEATRDADVSINPAFVAENPKIIESLKSIGVEAALKDRPGIYGLEQEKELPLSARTTFDVLVPERYAGVGRRAARIDGQENAAGRATGLELALWDKYLLELDTADAPRESVEVFVAGPAALLVAKAHKVHDRLQQFAIHPERLRPKDSGDIALLMMVSDPSEIMQVMRKNIKTHPEIAETVDLASRWLIELYGDASVPSVTRQQAADSLAARFDEAEVFSAIDSWLLGFQKSF